MNWADAARALGAAGLVLALCLSAAMAGPADWPEPVRRAQRDLQPPPVERTTGKSFTTVDPAVIGDELRREIEDRSAAKRFSRDGDMLAVTLSAQPGRSVALASFVEGLGGDVEATVDSEIYARVSPAMLKELAQRTDLLKLAVPQGVASGQKVVAGATAYGEQMQALVAGLRSSGISGRGIKLAVIDESPRADAFDPGSHGAACTTVVRSVAPEARVVEIGVDRLSEGKLLRAMTQARRMGAHVVSLSAAGFDFPLDGTASLDRAMQAEGPMAMPLWVVAAGNQAALHWHGRLQDRNANGWIDVRASDAPADQLLLRVARAGHVRMTVNWNDWAAFRSRRSLSDVDAFLYRVAEPGLPALIARSELDQAAGARPVERIELELDPGDYLLGLRATRLVKDVAIHVFVEGNAELLPALAERSLGVPGTAEAALTVGVLADGGEAYAAYSGRGPTDDGRRKPEAASRLPAGSHFAGTSAATPFVAGMSVLVAQRNPALKGMALKQKVMQFTRPVREGLDTLALDTEGLRTDLLKSH